MFRSFVFLSALLAGWPVVFPVAAAEPPGWTLLVLTEGGFVGTGCGNIRLSADGVLHILEPGGKKVARETKLSVEQVRAVSEVVKLANPTDWKRTYGGGARARDGYSYRLEMRIRVGEKEQVHAVAWDDNIRADELPKDLAQLVRVVKPLLQR